MAKKRYIVTYADPDTDIKSASKVMARAVSTRAGAMRDGVRAFASPEPFEKFDEEVLVFEGIGVSTTTLTAAQAKKLEDDPDVVAVEEDFEVHALANVDADAKLIPQPLPPQNGGELQEAKEPYPEAEEDEEPQPTLESLITPPQIVLPTPWNVLAVRANKAWPRTTGRDVKVAIIDTGIDDDHQDLSVYGGASFVSGVASWDDDHGHGTHCAGITGGRQSRGFIGVAPECKLYAAKVLDSSGSGSLSTVLAGMAWSVQNGMEVASMSLGSDVPAANTPASVAFQTAALQLINNGCIVIAAAGNAGHLANHWVGQPARCDGFMAVGSIDRQRNWSFFSSFGSTLGPLSNVEIAAPGSSINSTRMGGGHTVKSGTSMACPHVAGAAALLKQMHPTWSPARIRARLRDTATDLGAPGNDEKFGHGLVNCEDAVFAP